MREMNIEYIPLDELTPYVRNAKTHPDEQIKHIANSLIKFGWKQPIVIDAEYTVVVGHGRLLAAKKLNADGVEGFDKAPCIIADDLSDEEIKAYRLADNKLNESPWDFALQEVELSEIEELDMKDFGFEEVSSFDVSALDDLFADAPEKEKEPKKITCPHCGKEIEI